MSKALQRSLGISAITSESDDDKDEDQRLVPAETASNPMDDNRDSKPSTTDKQAVKAGRENSFDKKPESEGSIQGKKDEKEKKFVDDLSLSLGSLSEDDESSSTFDSTKLATQKEM